MWIQEELAVISTDKLNEDIYKDDGVAPDDLSTVQPRQVS